MKQKLQQLLKSSTIYISKIRENVNKFVRGINEQTDAVKSKRVIVAAAASCIVLIFAVLALLLRTTPKEQPPEQQIYKGIIQRGDTIYGLLKNYQVDDVSFLRIKAELKKLGSAHGTIQPGDKYEIVCSTTGSLDVLRMKHCNDPFKFVEIKKSSASVYSAEVKPIGYKKYVHGVQGKIKTSLYESMINQSLSAEMVMKFADIFQWEIDFLTEPRVGDSYKMVWEQLVTDDGIVKDGTVLISSYNGGETGNKLAVRFKGDYFNIKGESQKRVFLRAPLNFRRISSYFSAKRFHPILRYYRPHLGIDYAAARGTPVVSIGNGTVIFAGWDKGFGKMITIRHNGTYTSSYGHLSRFASKIYKGAHVNQGQLIGYVGSTGLSTGPHLDFRVKRNGGFVNFLGLKMPPAEGVKQTDMEQFNNEKRILLKYLSELDQTTKEQDIITLEDVSYSKS